MSESTRSIALHCAIQLVGPAKAPTTVVEAAEAFNTFLTADAANQAGLGAVGASAPKPAAAKPAVAAKPKPAATPAAPAQSEEEIVEAAVTKAQAVAEGPTREEVGAIVTSLLQAGKRDDAVALLGEFKAKSVSGVKETDFAAFVAKGQNLLLAA
jgi:hypothetical protein